MALYVVPNFHPGQGDFFSLDGGFNWMGWQNDGNNKAPRNGATVTVAEGDRTYRSILGGKSYMASASPWFSLTSVRPLSPKHADDGGSKWVNDMPHNGWLDMARPFIAAYKAGETSVNRHITTGQVIYWYRPTLTSMNCDSTDSTMGSADNSSGNDFNGRPNSWESMSDSILVVPLLTSTGTVTINSGGTLYIIEAPAGASAWSVPMGQGSQSFALSRGGTEFIGATSPCGIYNFNLYVSVVPEGEPDSLGPDGLTLLTSGLKVACEARRLSLPATPPQTAVVTATGLANSGPTSV